jgi:hypothetical protein
MPARSALLLSGCVVTQLVASAARLRVLDRLFRLASFGMT